MVFVRDTSLLVVDLAYDVRASVHPSIMHSLDERKFKKNGYPLVYVTASQWVTSRAIAKF